MTDRCQIRVALLSAEYPPQPGGVGDYTRRLAEALAQRGHHVAVLTGPVINQSGAAETVRRVELPIQCFNWRSWPAIAAAVARLRPDILHIQYQTGAYAMHPAINLLPAWLRRRPDRPRIVVTAHDLREPYLFPKAGPLRRWVTRRLLADADAAVLTNPQDYAQSITELGLRMPALIPIGSNIRPTPPPGFDRARWRADLGVGAHETLVAYFGLISPSKGVEVLLDALEQLPADVRLLVIGGEATAPQDRTYGAAIRQRIAGHLIGRVRITGHCAEEEVSGHLLAADMAALPFLDGASLRRGSLLAALTHGTPTITTRPHAADASLLVAPPGLPQFEDGDNVLLIPPGDPSALAAAVGRLVEDSALRARLAAGARALGAAFDWGAIAARHTELYTGLIGADRTSVKG